MAGRPARYRVAWQAITGQREQISSQRLAQGLTLTRVRLSLGQREPWCPIRTLPRFAVAELGFGAARPYGTLALSHTTRMAVIS